VATRPLQQGTVTSFDDDAGLGEVRADDGATHPFHCTSIADGTRSIEVGADVDFVVVPGRGGTWEAVRLRRG
jgi:cold shock CspA family protein